VGASGWHYFVPYDSDPARALAKLREDTFRAGTYHSTKKKKPASIEQLIEWCAESGTHSILDVSRTVAGPLPPSLNDFFQSLVAGGKAPDTNAIAGYMEQLAKFLGAVAPVPAEVVLAACGTHTPERAALEVAAFHFMNLAPRGCGYWTTAFVKGAPSELLFAGKSGD
jgi:hypothetical protein